MSIDPLRPDGYISQVEDQWPAQEVRWPTGEKGELAGVTPTPGLPGTVGCPDGDQRQVAGAGGGGTPVPAEC